MTEHYFTPRPEVPSDPRLLPVTTRGRRLAFFVDRGVFSSTRLDPGTALLLETIPFRPGQALLDLGCGWGPIGLVARLFVGEGQVVMVDTNARALALVHRTAEMWGVKVDIRQSDGFSAVKASETFDLIVTNPPIRAGKALYYRWASEARWYLRPGGTFWAVLRTRQGALSFETHLKTLFQDVQRQARRAGYRVLSARLPVDGRML